MVTFVARRGLYLVTCLALLGGSAAAQQTSDAHPELVLPVFEFHSGFWINLHHLLYQQARLANANGSHLATLPAASTTHSQVRRNESGEAPGDEAPSSSRSTALISTVTLTNEEQQAWIAALAYYGGSLSERDLLFNGDMVNINNVLADLESCADLSGRAPRCASGLRPELIAALEKAAVVYRARWWTGHDKANRAWIASVSPLVRQMGGALAQQLSAVYHAGWPEKRIRVDVVVYGGPVGAYTTLDPVHVTISSADPRNQGADALEGLFHEASHVLAPGVRDAIARECRRLSKPIPRDLWHALLFYTTGEIVKRALSQHPRSAQTDFIPYAYHYGLYSRGWENYQHGLERYWQPYLDGKADFDSAIARLVAAL